MKKGSPGSADSGVVKGLKQALLNEVDGAEFYRMAAKSARRDGVRQMYLFLMEEEERHREAILDQMERMASGRPFLLARGAAARKRMNTFKSPLFTEDLVRGSRLVEGEVAALSIGMTLEKRAIAQFVALRRKVAGDE